MVQIPFAKVACDGNELEYVQEVLASGWLTTAGKTLEFEKRFAQQVGAKHACAVNSCTAALHLAVEAVGIGPGDKVLVPTLTFTATAEVIRYVGADPIFLDVEYGSCLVTAEILEKALVKNPEVKAVVVVHFAGQAAAMADILTVCRSHGVKVIEDAAHAFPSRLDGRMIGSFGDITCFSFYANKTITTGEGGMLVTDDDAIYHRVKTMRLHGINRDIWDRFTSKKPSWEYDVVAPGFKYNMPDVNAAIGLAQLERASLMRVQRQHCFEHYLAHLTGLKALDMPSVRCPLADHSCHLFWVVLNDHSTVSRNHFIEQLADAGIGTSVHYKPLHRMTYYRERYQLREDSFPNSERHWRGCVSLPVYPGLSSEEMAYVVEQIYGILGV